MDTDIPPYPPDPKLENSMKTLKRELAIKDTLQSRDSAIQEAQLEIKARQQAAGVAATDEDAHRPHNNVIGRFCKKVFS